jgi:hypothetical protein
MVSIKKMTLWRLAPCGKEGIIMPAIKKQANESQHGRAIVDHTIKSHANDPIVLKKVERTKQMVDKYGLPGDKKK